MPQMENVWLPVEAARSVEVAKAPVGTLVYPFASNPVLIGIQPTGIAGMEAPRVLVDLETFASQLLDPPPENLDSGLAIPFTIEVDPMSAYAAPGAKFSAGDILSSGPWLGIVARAPAGNLLTLTISIAVSTAPVVGYRGWRIRAGTTVLFVRPDIG